MYGVVHGYQEKPENRVNDPFEALLALCRNLGLDYDIGQNPESGGWYAKLTALVWPGDFYGGAGKQTGKRSFTCAGCASKLEAVHQAILMAFSSLHASCEAWRSIVTQLPDYKGWFEPKGN